MKNPTQPPKLMLPQLSPMPLKVDAVAKAMLPLPPKANGCCEMRNEWEENDTRDQLNNQSIYVDVLF